MTGSYHSVAITTLEPDDGAGGTCRSLAGTFRIARRLPGRVGDDGGLPMDEQTKVEIWDMAPSLRSAWSAASLI